MNSDEARNFLQSTQQMRVLWAGIISRGIVFIIAFVAAVWSYFLKAYVDSVSNSPDSGLAFLAVAAGLSSILLGWWLLYSHFIYNRLAGLYPDLLFCENILGVEPDRGTAGYLQRTIPRLRRILGENELNPMQQQAAISFLVENKSLGRKSHLVLDVIGIVLIITMFVLCIGVHKKIQLDMAIGTILATILGLVLILCGIFIFQRYPSQSIVSTAVEKYEYEEQNK